jgi:hypothetical protein
MSKMNRVRDEQCRRNEISRECWNLYTAHRQRVTDLLLDAHATDGGRLCVLGAGNCNDLDLQRLAAHFRTIHLVDIDPLAMPRAVAAQGPFAGGQIEVHASVDLSGLADWLGRWTPGTPPHPAEVDRVIAEVDQRCEWMLAEPIDVAASVCLLSQIIDSIALSIGPEHPRFVPLLMAVRAVHLRRTVALLRPGGCLLLITDFNASTACPELTEVPDDQLAAYSSRLIAGRNFFTGLNPFALRALFETDAWLSKHVHRVHLTKPWRWTFPTRTYLVFAIRARRRDTA